MDETKLKKPRNYISFSSFLEDERIFTQVDLNLQKVHITKGEKVFFSGTIEEFKKLEKMDTRFTSIYTDLLDMIEYLSEVLTKE